MYGGIPLMGFLDLYHTVIPRRAYPPLDQLMKLTIAVLLHVSSIGLMTLSPNALVQAQVQSTAPSQSDRDFLNWVDGRLQSQDISPEIMTDDAKIFSAKDFCGRLEQGTTVSNLQQGFIDLARGYDDPESRRLMLTLSTSLLYGGLTYYCPQYMSQTEYAQLID